MRFVGVDIAAERHVFAVLAEDGAVRQADAVRRGRRRVRPRRLHGRLRHSEFFFALTVPPLV